MVDVIVDQNFADMNIVTDDQVLSITVPGSATWDSITGIPTPITDLAATGSAPDFRNPIINGTFDFWQRATSHSGNGYGSADRWYISTSGGTSTLSRNSFTLGAKLGRNNPAFFATLAVSGQAGSNSSRLRQAIPSVRNFAGEKITILGWAQRFSGTGNLNVRVAQGFGTGGSPSATTSTAQQLVSLVSTPSWTPFAVVVDVPSISGKTLGTNGDDCFVLDFTISDGTAALGVQTISVGFWGIHILSGEHTTAALDNYVPQLAGDELNLCQRFYEICLGGGVGTSTAASGQFIGSAVNFAVQKRILPTVTRLSDVSINNVSTPYAEHIQAQGFRSMAQVTATGSVGFATRYAAEAEILL